MVNLDLLETITIIKNTATSLICNFKAGQVTMGLKLATGETHDSEGSP